MRLSKLTQNLSPSMTLVISDRARELKTQGINIITFATGEPDFDTPENVKEEAIKSLEAGNTKYTASNGIPAVKEAVCRKLERENGVKYSPKQIILGNGAKQMLYEAMLAILSPGDEVILPIPCWVSYTEQVKMVGAVPVLVNTTAENDFEPEIAELEKAITPKTKAIVLNTPNNPTGAVFSKKCLEGIAELAVKHNIWVIADEVYEKLLYDDGSKHYSIASFGPEIFNNTITINGWSKTFAMTGWRMGYAAGPDDVIKAMGELHGHTTGNINSFAQMGGAYALDNSKDYEEFVKVYKQRRDYMVGRLNAMDGIECRMPKGAFYVFPSVKGLIGKKYGDKILNSAMDVAEFLIDEARIAVVPSEAFMYDGFIRLSYATATNLIEEGMDNMEKAIKTLK